MAESDLGPSESRDQRAMKRRKPDSAEAESTQSRRRETSLKTDAASPTPSTSAQTPRPAEIQIPEDKLALWLAALTRQELEQVAAGVKWNTGDPHSPDCFLCKRSGGLIGCRRCPRAYCRGCLRSSSGEPNDIDNWNCPACALLELGEIRDLAAASQISTPKGAVCSTMNPSLPKSATIVSAGYLEGSPQPNSSYIQIVTNQPSPSPAKARTSVEIKVPKSDPERGKKRSRYSTLPSEVDEALAIINRELEAASYSKSIIAHTEARLHVAEQDLAIERGKSVLAVPLVNQDEVHLLQEEIKRKNILIERLLKDNEELKAEAHKYSNKVKDLEDWKRRMKMMIDGTSET